MKGSRPSSGVSGRELKHLLLKLCECAYGDVRRLAEREDVAVHQLRVRMKKVDALLRLARDGVDPHSMRAMRQHVKAVKAASASSRDEAVKARLIDKLEHRHQLHIKRRSDLGPKGGLRPSATFLQHQIHALEQLVTRTPFDSITAAQLLHRYAQCYRKGRRLMKAVAASRDDATLHRWRHRVKDFYFQTLVFAQLSGAGQRVRRARRLGTLLGRDHDFSVLAHEAAFSSRRGPWPDIIQERRDMLRERCLHLGHKLFARHATRFNSHLQVT